MQIDVTFFSILVATAVAYVGLLVYILRLDEPIGVERWMAVYCAWSVVVAGAFALSGTHTYFFTYAPGLWMALASMVSLCLLYAITFGYLELPRPWIWAALIPVLLLLILLGEARDPTDGLLQKTWVAALAPEGGWLPITVAAAWIIIASVLVGLTYFAVTQATLPLLANRRFWWVIALLVIFFGEGAAMWVNGITAIMAQALRLVGVALAVYATTKLELLDVRGLVRATIGNVLFVIAMAIFIIGGVVAWFYIGDNLPEGQRLIAIGGVAILLSLVYQRIRPALHKLVARSVLAAGYDPAQIAKGYSQRIANIIDIGELAVSIGMTVVQAVQSTKLGLLLLTPEEDATRADVLIGAGRLPTRYHNFRRPNPFLQTLTTTRRPLSQYALDYDPKFRSLPPEDRAWLRSLSVDIFVPVFDGQMLSAMMAIGARKSGDSYRPAELELLASIADQTSVALKNARLVANLRILNEEMRTLYESTQLLNKELGQSNERLRQMDKVKTDFISIASHELRTPLTKMRGYTDILNEMNKTGNADKGTLDMATRQLSKACLRLEEVIGQMLDVSQLDVEALELSFAETSVPKILDFAVERFKQSVSDRKQTLTIHDSQDLPPIEGDFQRLVQTFQQLVGNAIKFTPDKGRIDIYTHYLPANEDRDRPAAIEIIVADTGVGINPEHYELIFEKFYRVGSVDLHSTGDTKFMGAGPGLGLTIARGVIKGHGGQIWVESDGFDKEKCPGSQFHIILPVKPPAPAPQPSRAPADALRV